MNDDSTNTKIAKVIERLKELGNLEHDSYKRELNKRSDDYYAYTVANAKSDAYYHSADLVQELLLELMENGIQI